MSEPYLIAHIVRGEPAFDIAIKLQIGDEEGWIIPTSGHRAYPYWNIPLEVDQIENGMRLTMDHIPKLTWTIFEPPSNHPDHYPPASAPRGTGLITNLAERLGFLPKAPTITRRR